MRPTRLVFTGGKVAFVHMDFDEVTARIAERRAKGQPKVAFDGRWFEIDRVVEIIPPAPHDRRAA